MNQKGRGLEILINEKQDGQWLFSVLKTALKASKPVIQDWMSHQQIKVNHESVLNNMIVKKGDRVFIDLQESEASSVIPEYGELDILYEDNHMLIVNKPWHRDASE